jgi:hypothetical protein
MKRSLSFSASAAAFLTAAASAAAYCDSFPTVEQEFKNSALVFIAKVIGTRDVRVRSEAITGGTFYSVAVEEVLKGTPPKTVELYSENSSGRFPMEVGVQYLVFANYGVFEGITGQHPAINNCGNSEPLSKAHKALAIVRKLAKA